MDYFWGSKPGGGLGQRNSRFLKLQGSGNQVSTLGLRVPEMGPLEDGPVWEKWTDLVGL